MPIIKSQETSVSDMEVDNDLHEPAQELLNRNSSCKDDENSSNDDMNINTSKVNMEHNNFEEPIEQIIFKNSANDNGENEAMIDDRFENRHILKKLLEMRQKRQ